MKRIKIVFYIFISLYVLSLAYKAVVVGIFEMYN